MMSGSIEKLFSFGAVADVQHANIDDGYDFHRTKMRFYRHALVKFKEVIETWNESKVDFGVQLGDIIDGFSKKHGQTDKDITNLIDVVNQFKSTGLPITKCGNVSTPLTADNAAEGIVPYMCHLWGNHEFYNFSRSYLWNSELNSYVAPISSSAHEEWNSEDVNNHHGYYYSFSHKGYRFVALDTYDIAKISRPKESEIHKKAMDILTKKNKTNDLMKSDPSHPHIVSWNGGLSNIQLSWLHNELAAASACEEKVIILSHVPLHPEASRKASVCWNFTEVHTMLNTFDCVVACLAGHYHNGGYYHDMDNGIHYMTLQGVIECDPATNAYAILNVYSDRMEIKGYGKIESRILKFKKK